MSVRRRVLRLNAPLGGLFVGATVRVEVDKNNVVTDQYWRRRVKDALTDNCVVFVEPPKVPKASRADKEAV